MGEVQQDQGRQDRVVLADREEGQRVPEAEEGSADEVAGRVVEGGGGEGLVRGGVAQGRDGGERRDDDEEGSQKRAAAAANHCAGHAAFCRVPGLNFRCSAGKPSM